MEVIKNRMKDMTIRNTEEQVERTRVGRAEEPESDNESTVLASEDGKSETGCRECKIHCKKRTVRTKFTQTLNRGEPRGRSAYTGPIWSQNIGQYDGADNESGETSSGEEEGEMPAEGREEEDGAWTEKSNH